MAKTRCRGITYNEASNTYRAAISINGKSHQRYASTLPEALQKLEDLKTLRNKSRSHGSRHTKKRESAEDQSLPPGYHITEYWKDTLRNGPTLYQHITTAIVSNGVCIKTLSAAFGVKRTKQEALKLLYQRRINFCKRLNIPLD